MAGIMGPALWQRYGNAAQIASALVAISAVIGVVWQVHSNIAFSRENTAREIYRAYLQLAVQYPQLAYPENAVARRGEEKARYSWFVSYLLYTCDQILESFPTDRQWLHTCGEQIGYHGSYVCSSVVTDEINQYDEPLRKLIQQVAKGSTVPECKKT